VGAHRQPLAERIDGYSVRHPHGPVVRTLLRSPIVLWRLGLGPLLGRLETRGGHLVMLTVTGRSSGLPRHTPVTAHVVGDETYLWCPYGGRSEWFRNAKADPVVTVQSRGSTRVMRAVAIEDVDDVMRVVGDLRHFDETFLRSYLAAEGIADRREDIARNAERLHLRRLQPTTEEGPPPLEADLAWLWVVPLVAAAWGVVGWVRRGHEVKP
jgi:deazaflavin-dependent oxidoreductase (nitroreductase family)